MAERLHRDGHPVYPVPLGTQMGCIVRKADLLRQFIDRHNLDDGEDYDAPFVSAWSVSS
jgi:hypothetical protein